MQKYKIICYYASYERTNYINKEKSDENMPVLPVVIEGEVVQQLGDSHTNGSTEDVVTETMRTGILYEEDPGQGTDEVFQEADAQQHVDDEQWIACHFHPIDDPRLMGPLHIDLDHYQQQEAEHSDQRLLQSTQLELILPVHVSQVDKEVGYERVVDLPVVVFAVEMACQQNGSREGYPGEDVEEPCAADEHGTGKLYLGNGQSGYEPRALALQNAGDDLLEGVVGHGSLGKGQQQREGEIGEDDAPEDGPHLPGKDKGPDVRLEQISRQEEEGYQDIGHIEVVGDDLPSIIVVGLSMEEEDGQHAKTPHLVDPEDTVVSAAKHGALSY